MSCKKEYGYMNIDKKILTVGCVYGYLFPILEISKFLVQCNILAWEDIHEDVT